MNSKKLRIIRDIIIIVSIIGGFILWLFLPSVFENTSFFHVGNGKYGSKIGALLMLLIPLTALFPVKNDDEIHTDDQEEKTKLLENRNIRARKTQIIIAIGNFFIVLGIMGAVVLLTR